MEFLFISILYLLLAKATDSLQNVALLKGQTLTHKCNMSNEMHFHSWYFIPFGENVEKIIYGTKGLNGEYVKRAQVDNSSLVLTIPSIQLDDAGIYGCKTLHNATVINERAQVIVIESKLKICRNEASWLTCEVKYKGNLGPVIEWTNNGPTESIAINSTLRNDSDANGIRHLTLMTNSVNSTLTCQLYFKDLPTHFEDMATDIPTYTDRCNSSDCCNSSSGTTMTSPGSFDRLIQDSVPYPLLSAIIGSFLFILIIVVVGLILEKKRVFKKTKFKPKKKRSRPVELPGPDIVRSDDTANVVTEGLPELSLSVYARIVSDESDYLSADESQTMNQNRFVAPDGTEYMIMNTMTADGTSSARTPVAPISSLFTSTVYASIDHTLQSHCPQTIITPPQSPRPLTPSMGIFRHSTAKQPPIPSPRNISRKN